MYLAALPNLFGPDGLVLFLIILLLFGAKKLPELARGLGQAVREFSRAKDDFHNEITRPVVEPPPPQPAPPRIEEPKTEVVQDHNHETHQSSTPV
jgi:sec-independent protein translocase protein TatA